MTAVIADVCKLPNAFCVATLVVHLLFFRFEVDVFVMCGKFLLVFGFCSPLVLYYLCVVPVFALFPVNG